jgi:hypothetical protein
MLFSQRVTQIKKMLFIAFSLTLLGCSNTPYKDDYTKHINQLNEHFHDDSKFEFSFEKEIYVDLRGQYSRDDTTSSSPMLYQGGAGIAGLIVQIGAHASIINAQRNDKLAQAQELANTPILHLINLSQDITLLELIGEHKDSLAKQKNINDKTVKIKPIFFSNHAMTELSLKSIVWISTQKKGKNKQFKYKNMIQVYGRKLNKIQQKKLAEGDKELLAELLSSLIKTTINITKDELTGKYSKINNPAQTFFINRGNKKEVVRGSLIAKKCGVQVIRNLHSWFIAYPQLSDSTNTKNNLVPQC